ncbi:MAG: hypothetical protein QM773_21615 [Hyphomonadaceae bacterium]
MMRSLIFPGLIVLVACGEAPFKAPRPEASDLDGAPPKSIAFPSGDWTDDYGDLWKASVDEGKVSAVASCGPRLGSVLSGNVAEGVLDCRISDGAGAEYAAGRAQLINDRHAFFETRFKDGSATSEGLLHLLHDAPVRKSGPTSSTACVEIPVPPPLAAPTNPTP